MVLFISDHIPSLLAKITLSLLQHFYLFRSVWSYDNLSHIKFAFQHFYNTTKSNSSREKKCWKVGCFFFKVTPLLTLEKNTWPMLGNLFWSNVGSFIPVPLKKGEFCINVKMWLFYGSSSAITAFITVGRI